MGLLQQIRDALALPALAANPNLATPFAGESHLLSLSVDDFSIRRNVSRETAMGVPALARARRLIAASIARCPLEATRAGELLEPQPNWLTRTDGPVSPFHRMLWTIDDLMFHGWSLWSVARGKDNQVIAADRVPISDWGVSDNQIVYRGRPVDPQSVILIPGVDEGLLKSAAGVIRHAEVLQNSAAKAADSPIAHTELHQTSGAPLSQKDVEALVKSWIAARQSSTGAVSFTNQAIEVKTHGNFDGAMLIEARAASALDIARVTGIPAILLDASAADGSVRYSNVDARNTEFIDFCLAPFMAAVSARLGMDDVVPRGVSIRFDTRDLTGIKRSSNVDAPDDVERNEDET